MKVAIDARALNNTPTGIESYVEILLSCCKEIDAGIQYTIFTTKEQAAKIVGNRFKVIISPPWQMRFARGWFLNVVLRSLINRMKIDVFHSIENAAPLGKLNAKTIVTIHDLSPFLYPDSMSPLHALRMRFYIRHAVNKADMIITPTRAVANEVKAMFRVGDDRLSTVPNGIREYYFTEKCSDSVAILSELGIESPYFLCVGTLQPRKNIKSVFKAFVTLTNEIRDSISIVHVGGPGWLHRDTVRMLDSLERKERIRMLGYTEMKTLKVLYENTVGFIFPSLYEGFGMPAVEAMACGAPVIASDIPVLREVIADAGIFVSPCSPEEIASAIVRLLMSERTRRELSMKGRKRARVFTQKNMVEATIKAYREVM